MSIITTLAIRVNVALNAASKLRLLRWNALDIAFEFALPYRYFAR
jgi:hypothetical protein